MSALTSPPPLAPLPFLTEGEAIQGALRDRPEDFFVEELPAYEPAGEGEHLYLFFEKRGLDTQEAIRRLAEALGADARAAGYAGLKDRHAVTRQWASFGGVTLPAEEALEAIGSAPIPGIEALRAARHGNKLRTGHLRGNRFRILLRGADPDALEESRRRLDRLVAQGVPNFFGAQRFGHGGSNWETACAWLIRGGRAPRSRFHRKLMVSVLQSGIFNHALAERVREGRLLAIEAGDLLMKEPTGGLFLCDDPETDRRRAEAWELSPTGPLFGAKMRWPTGAALAREEALLATFGLTRADLSRFKKAGEGARRAFRAQLSESSVEAHEEGLLFSFTLPKGSYATVVLREFLREG